MGSREGWDRPLGRLCTGVCLSQPAPTRAHSLRAWRSAANPFPTLPPTPQPSFIRTSSRFGVQQPWTCVLGPYLIFYKGFSWVFSRLHIFLVARHGLQDLSSPKGLNLCPLQCKHRALTTGLPGNSPDSVLNVPFGKHTRERGRMREGGKRQRQKDKGEKEGGGVEQKREWEKKKRKERRGSSCECHHAGTITSSQK